MKEVDEYLENYKQIISIDGEIQKTDRLSSYKIDKIYEKFIDIISNIKEQKDNITYDIESRKGNKVNSLSAERDKIYEKIKEVNGKIKFLKLQSKIEKEKLDFEGKIKSYNDKDIECLGVLYHDKYIVLKIYIVENDKPVNKYSLVVYGKSKFPKEIIDYPYSYGLPTRDDTFCNIKTSVKDLPTKKELKEYLKRNKNRVLQDTIDRHKFVRDLYLETINKYSLKDFEDIFKPIEVSENEAQIVCIIDKDYVDKKDKYYKKEVWRIYNDFYYRSVKKIDSNPLYYIKVINDNKIYEQMCRKELMMITQNGNTVFGDWWTMKVEEYSFRGGIQFTKENYDKTLEKAKGFVDGKNKNRNKKVHFSYPKVEWVNEHLIRHIDRLEML